MKFRNKLFCVSVLLTVVINVGLWTIVFSYVYVTDEVQAVVTGISVFLFVWFYKWKVEKEVIETLKEL